MKNGKGPGNDVINIGQSLWVRTLEDFRRQVQSVLAKNTNLSNWKKSKNLFLLKEGDRVLKNCSSITCSHVYKLFTRIITSRLINYSMNSNQEGKMDFEQILPLWLIFIPWACCWNMEESTSYPCVSSSSTSKKHLTQLSWMQCFEHL